MDSPPGQLRGVWSPKQAILQVATVEHGQGQKSHSCKQVIPVESTGNLLHILSWVRSTASSSAGPIRKAAQPLTYLCLRWDDGQMWDDVIPHRPGHPHKCRMTAPDKCGMTTAQSWPKVGPKSPQSRSQNNPKRLGFRHPAPWQKVRMARMAPP